MTVLFKYFRVTGHFIACEQALLFERAKRAVRERASERRSREGPAKGELATIPFKFSFVLRPDKGKYHWLKNDVPEILSVVTIFTLYNVPGFPGWK